MEQSKHPILRKLLTGVEAARTGEATSRWAAPTAVPAGRAPKASSSSIPPRAMPVTGSVRERAKAFEERYAGNSAAFVPCPTPVGSAGQRRQHRTPKSSYESAEAPRQSSSKDADVRPPSRQQAQTRASDDKENTDSLMSGNVEKRSSPAAKDATPKQAINAYDLPIAGGSRPLAEGKRTQSVTPLADSSSKHVSMPSSTDSPSRSGTSRPTVRAGAFQAARSRSNSMPRQAHAEANTRTSPPSQAQHLDDDTQSIHVTAEPAVTAPSRPIQRGQDAASEEVPERERRDAPRVSAVPLPASIGRRSSSYIKKRPVSQIIEPSRVSGLPIGKSKDSPPKISQAAHLRRAEAASTPESWTLASADCQKTSPTSNSKISASQDESTKRSLRPLPSSAGMERAHSASAAMPESPARKERPRSMTLSSRNPAEIDGAFREFIESLNLPDTVAKRMLGVDAHVKLEMLKSSTPGSTLSKGTASLALGEGKSNSHARMPIPQFGEKGEAPKSAKKRPAIVRKMKSFISNKDSVNEVPDGFLLVEPTSPRAEEKNSVSFGRPSADLKNEVDPAVSQHAAGYALSIRTKTNKQLDPVNDVRKLRMLLRHESIAWVSEWIKFGGYRGLMERLHEVLTKEWREEQHDDKILMELLKCFRGLLQSKPGRQCLATYSPSPFRPMMEVLYSDKKPGDLASRKCVVEIMTGLFDVHHSDVDPIASSEWRTAWSDRENFGARSNASAGRAASIDSKATSPQLPDLQFRKDGSQSSNGSSAWESAGFADDFSFVSEKTKVSLRDGRVSRQTDRSIGSYYLVKSLLLGPPNEKEEGQIYFIKSTRRSRPFKLWMEEIIGVLSDYFWIFCHTGNKYWRLENIQQDQLELPTVPGGQTGGVEFEAMEYCASHLQLLNRVCRHCPAGQEAIDLHADFFASGFDKVLLTLRKCSTAYYPQVHLELARYIDLCLSSGYPLHPEIRRHIDPVTSLKQSLSASKLAQQQAAAAAKKGHNRSRTEGNIVRP